MKVLIIDDDNVDCEAMTKILASSDQGIEIDSADTGQKALEKLKESEFDAIIVDYMLPDYNGLKLVEQIREHTSTPIVFVTGQGSEITATQAIQSGAQNYFPKDKLQENGDLFYKVVFAPSNLQYLEVLSRLQLLRKQTRFLEQKMNVVEKLDAKN